MITGQGTFVDDISPPNTKFIHFIRSEFAHARISVQYKGCSPPGVIGVFTHLDLDSTLRGPSTICDFKELNNPGQPLLAKDVVRFIGEPIVMIIAETKQIALMEAKRVIVNYEKLESVIGLQEAMEVKKSMVKIHENINNNLAYHWEQEYGQKEFIEEADQSFDCEFIIPRVAPVSLEPRGLVASYDPKKDTISLITSTQIPHSVKLGLSYSLNHPEHKIEVKAVNVGGAFGSKMNVYREEVLACYFSKKLNLTLKYIETRTENFTSTTQGRDQIQKIRVYHTKEGIVLGLDVHLYANMGAYLQAGTPAIPLFTSQMLSGCYKISYINIKIDAYYTNQTPTDAYRGAGRPEATYLVERVIDLVAKKCGIDPIDIRKKNFIQPNEFPKKVVTNLVYDSGNYEQTLNKAIKLSNLDWWRQEQELRRASRASKQLGIGLSTYVEFSGSGPSKNNALIGLQSGGFESALVRVHPSGSITVISGSCPSGQGHETSWTMLVEKTLGVSRDNIQVVTGSTLNTPWGGGTFGSRSASVGGMAIYEACLKIISKGKKFVSHLWKIPIKNIGFYEGIFSYKDKKISLLEVTKQLYLGHHLPKNISPGLEETVFFEPSNFTFPYGTHICIAEIDTRNGFPEILQYYSVDDCGNVMQEQIVKGQIIGGIYQGFGEAFFEEVVHSSESKHLLTNSFRNYKIPTSIDTFPITIDKTVTPSPVNKLGIKGAGESGTIGSLPAITNAIINALSLFDIEHLDMPLTPDKIWKAINESKKSSGFQ
ncbi:xanthine dehydrogenase family protein molybdopterin-binding subunit [Cytobacillus oceanisediminis]|uniref:xanthine dehydrogenase family protein molybdopterin-binding subunit n=1 Tax=Cytobacillus oceanisediminis TaxID=665099 RepID=UPI001C21458F|nr:xanthine dehydrogenase family protein molybdopterin-binding subunit [Cytobacillus oceanisediminis]MBU8772074.1 xanthine dehydrogenase family protein molybdopterin-binding subunit [Cytobacillus oceanisediminis]